MVAFGCAIFGLDKPIEGDQEYVFPAIASVPICKDGFVQDKVTLAPASANGVDISCEISTSSVAVQPFAVFVTVKVYKPADETVG